MIPVQYRDPQTEEILERRYEEGEPAIGMRVRIGFDEYRVLYRCRRRASSTCTGSSVRSVRRPGLRPEQAFGSERSGARLARVASLWKL
jgi:hypothetical protein